MAELKRGAKGLFVKGTAAGPGPRKGSRYKLKPIDLRSFVASIKGDPEAAIEKIMGALMLHAESGNVLAAEVFLRYYQPRPARPLGVALPKLTSLADVSVASALIIDALATGKISEADSELYHKVLNMHRANLETSELSSQMQEALAKLSGADQQDYEPS
jgi:hypothetical protein